MFSSLVRLILSSLEFFRSEFGRWIVLLWDRVKACKVFVICSFLYGVWRFVITAFNTLIEKVLSLPDLVSDSIGTMQHSTAYTLLQYANQVLPINETCQLVVVWAALSVSLMLVSFVISAYKLIPFKGT